MKSGHSDSADRSPSAFYQHFSPHLPLAGAKRHAKWRLSARQEEVLLHATLIACIALVALFAYLRH
ncbi:hypothetical protein HNO92_003350 [Chromobacterium alkanivorans]|uniref:hypothetical protein n=1 Tax=Chromobacterium TaxID=535 RepID=UPI0006532A4E|nr:MULTISPECIES: hypothetical protein [Chromobacterium]KMN81106.1 hypothetical protein VK98_14455 [Chromobacterium sp. LK11]MBN3004291.1 hypothetical protein [Chromobacterium alkanivorans]MCS3805922.1 hypothetical protein [Chromobacterium alkanivorans]MCS3820260.1 hypothetical protein [Chromobacterium alkanivorans]MCS3875018.1 hypothetical protein [Chromobacterium alkanivorans]